MVDHQRPSAKNTALLDGLPIRLESRGTLIRELPCPKIVRWTDSGSLWIGAQPPSILTCAVGPEGGSFVSSVLSSLLNQFADHYREIPLVVIPFENEPVEILNHLLMMEPRYTSRFVIFDAIVDRICKSIDVVNEAIVVATERYYRVVLRIPSLSQRKTHEIVRVLEDSQLIDYVAASDDEFQFERLKKAWAVNGLHYVLALRAIAENERYDVSLTELFGPDGVDHEYLRAVTVDFSLAISFLGRDLGQAVSFADISQLVRESADRLLEAEEAPARLIRGLEEVARAIASMVRPDPTTTRLLADRYSDFLVKWDTRVSAATRSLLQGLPTLGSISYVPQLPMASDMLMVETGRLFSQLLTIEIAPHD